jgi:superfamily II DNA/RNA helicase
MLTEDYVHRIGRTARSTNSGTAFTLITNDNARHLPKLIDLLKEANQEISEDVLKMARQFCGPRYGNSNNFKPSKFLLLFNMPNTA